MSRRRRWSVSRGSCRVRPPVSAVAVTQDRISEKQFLERSGFPTAPFRPVRNERELQAAVREVALPALLKTSRLGYDGKGQAPVDRPEDAPPAFRALGSVPCVLERRLALETEVSVVLARGDDGAVAAFPVGENRHRNGILETTVVPAQVGRDTLDAARSIACRVATALEYVGVLGVEMFVADGGRIYVNELAPRPHNSGHYTLDACSVDQFEQQLRALCGLPARRAAVALPGGDDQPARRSLVVGRAALGRGLSSAWREAAPLRQGRAEAGAEDGSPELPRRRSSPGAGARRGYERRPGRFNHSPGVVPHVALRHPGPDEPRGRTDRSHGPHRRRQRLSRSHAGQRSREGPPEPARFAHLHRGRPDGEALLWPAQRPRAEDDRGRERPLRQAVADRRERAHGHLHAGRSGHRRGEGRRRGSTRSIRCPTRRSGRSS